MRQKETDFQKKRQTKKKKITKVEEKYKEISKRRIVLVSSTEAIVVV